MHTARTWARVRNRRNSPHKRPTRREGQYFQVGGCRLQLWPGRFRRFPKFSPSECQTAPDCSIFEQVQQKWNTDCQSQASHDFDLQEPIGFWDPLGRGPGGAETVSSKLRIRYVSLRRHDDLLGLSADKDQATFKRRRAVEIKHGRIAADSNP